MTKSLKNVKNEQCTLKDLDKARSEEGKYRAFKNSLYSPTMPNLDVSVLKAKDKDAGRSNGGIF